jgi:anti-anti-sigma factor
MLEERSFSIDVRDDGDVLIVAPNGEIDLVTSPRIVEAFASRSDGHTELICDVTGVTFMDSTGIQALLWLAENEPARFALAGTSQPVERLLDLTCCADRFRRVESGP